MRALLDTVIRHDGTVDERETMLGYTRFILTPEQTDIIANMATESRAKLLALSPDTSSDPKEFMAVYRCYQFEVSTYEYLLQLSEDNITRNNSEEE